MPTRPKTGAAMPCSSPSRRVSCLRRSGPVSWRLRLDVALEAAEDGQVARLQVRRASQWDDAQHDVRESGLRGGHGGLAGVDAGHVAQKDPRLSVSAWIQHFIQSGRWLQDRGRCPATLRRDAASVLWPWFRVQDGVCLARVYDLHQHVQRATVHPKGDSECPDLLRQLGLFRHRGGPTRSGSPAGCLVDVHHAICADAICAHEPAQLDEEPIRVGVLLLRAVELLRALGGLLVAQGPAMQEPLGPTEARMGASQSTTKRMIVTALRHWTSVSLAGCVRSAKSSCRAVLLLVRCVSTDSECSG